jgi:hypothetical protein
MRRHLQLSLCALLALPLPAPAGDKEHWRNVRGGGLRTLLQDQQFCDGVHFAYRFRSDGTFRGMEMGRQEHGTWRIVKDELCWKWSKPPGSEECYQVQQDAAHVRLMLNGSEAWYGMLKKVR